MDGDRAPDDPRLGGLLHTTISEHASAVCLSVVGEVDIATAARLRTALDEATDRLVGRRLVVDLRQVAFLGSVGIGLLADAAGAVGAEQAEPVAVLVHKGPVLRVLQLSGLTEIVHVADRLEAVIPGTPPPS
jgi:anti-sigma B factor antagonist